MDFEQVTVCAGETASDSGRGPVWHVVPLDEDTRTDTRPRATDAQVTACATLTGPAVACATPAGATPRPGGLPGGALVSPIEPLLARQEAGTQHVVTVWGPAAAGAA